MREILLIAAALVARQAKFGVLPGIAVEREDQLAGRGSLRVVALGGFLAVGMRLARPMAHFATGRRTRFRGFEPGVMGQVELQSFRFVAGLATLYSHISGIGRRQGSHADRRWRRRLRTCVSQRRCGQKKHH